VRRTRERSFNQGKPSVAESTEESRMRRRPASATCAE
jgi:hypothetical protein